MNDLGFSTTPTGRALADRLGTFPLETAILDSDLHAYGHVFSGIDWAITGQVAIVELARLTERFEESIDGFVDRIHSIGQPPARVIVIDMDAGRDALVLAQIGMLGPRSAA